MLGRVGGVELLLFDTLVVYIVGGMVILDDGSELDEEKLVEEEE